MDVILFILIGLMIGIFSGFFGIGGGIILTPLLLLFGYPPTAVIGTSLMLSLGTSISGALAHFRLKTINWTYVFVINIFGIIGTQIAHPIMLRLESMGIAEQVISLLYIFLLGFFSYTLLNKKSSKPKEKKRVLPPMMIACLIGLGAGILSSALGVSGGFFIVPLLISLLRFTSSEAVGTSLASVFFIVAAGFLSYSFSSSLNYMIGIFLVIGTFIGSPLGAKATVLIEDKLMKKLLGVLYLCIICSVISNIFSFPLIGISIIALFTFLFFSLLLKRKFQTLYNKQQESH